MAKWEQLVTARERKHLSQMEAAECLNVGLVTYQGWELGKRKPQPQHMRRLCEVFGTLLEHNEVASSFIGKSAVTLPESVLSPVEMSTSLLKDDTNELHTFVTENMSSRLWSLAFTNHSTSSKKRSAIRQAIKEFDSMNTDNKNYQITRREALRSLAALPTITLGLAIPGKTVPPTQYGSALAQCAASLEACWELSRSNDASDIMLAFQSASKYLSILETVAKEGSQHHQREALDLATRYALIKTILGRHCVGPAEALAYAKIAVSLSNETGDVSLQLSAYCKLAGTYFFDKQYTLAEKTAQESHNLLQHYQQLSYAEPLLPCIKGGTFSTLALMQAKTGKSSDLALKKALEIDPGNEPYIFMDFKRSSLLLDSGWISCYQGNQSQAMAFLEQRVDPETLAPKIPQSELGRLETINAMALSSLKMKERDMVKTIHFWVAAIEGAKTLKSQLLFNNMLTIYEHMEVIWSGEPHVANLRDHLVHWEN